MNWTDDLIPETDVSIRSSGSQLIVSFSRLPDSTILGELNKLNEKPGFSISNYHDSDTDYLVFKPETYRHVTVAKAIQNMLESHGLDVTVKM